MENKSFDAWDPFYDHLEKNAVYDICGLINAKVEQKNVKRRFGQGKLLLYRVPVRLGVDGNYTQAIIEIWSSTKDEQPTFTSDWRRLQFVFLREVKFVGDRELFGLKYLQFVMPSDPASRYIWLSGSEIDYWMMPIPDPEDPRLYSTADKHHGDSTSVRGFLGKSSGSVFGKIYSTYHREIHSTTLIGETSFFDWYNEVMEYKSFFLKYERSNSKEKFLLEKSGPLRMFT